MIQRTCCAVSRSLSSGTACRARCKLQVGQRALPVTQQAPPLVEKRRTARRHQQRSEVQRFRAVHHRPAAIGDNDFVVEAVLPQHVLMDDAITVVHQPPTQFRLAAVGLQNQLFLSIDPRFTGLEDVANRLAAHAAEADRGNAVLRFNRPQTIGQTHADVLLEAVLAHRTFGRPERRRRHLPRHGHRNEPTAHQRHRQVGVIGADVGQSRVGRHQRRHALQAPGQCVFVQPCRPLSRHRPARPAETGRESVGLWRGFQLR